MLFRKLIYRERFTVIKQKTRTRFDAKSKRVRFLTSDICYLISELVHSACGGSSGSGICSGGCIFGFVSN